MGIYMTAEEWNLVVSIIMLAIAIVGGGGGIIGIIKWVKGKDKEIEVLKSENTQLKNKQPNSPVPRAAPVDDLVRLIHGKDLAENTIGEVLDGADANTVIKGIFHDATFPKEIERKIEIAITNGARFEILMYIGDNSIENAKLLKKLSNENSGTVIIHDFNRPKNSSPVSLNNPPGNFRMIQNNKSISCLLGIAHPKEFDYMGVYMLDKSFYEMMRELFDFLFPEYLEFELKEVKT